MVTYDDYGITPEQYHAGLDKLWDALREVDPAFQEGKDVFTLAADTLKIWGDGLTYWKARADFLEKQIADAIARYEREKLVGNSAIERMRPFTGR